MGRPKLRKNMTEEEKLLHRRKRKLADLRRHYAKHGRVQKSRAEPLIPEDRICPVCNKHVPDRANWKVNIEMEFAACASCFCKQIGRQTGRNGLK